MVQLRDWIATLGAVAGGAFLAGPVSAQAEQGTPPAASALDSLLGGATVALKVDGMSCPFCSHGLEKRLREIAAVDTLVVRVSDGLVLIRVKEGQEITDEALHDAVERAGFSLREVRRVDLP